MFEKGRMLRAFKGKAPSKLKISTFKCSLTATMR